MCRLAAYSGPPIALKTILLDSAHSLYRQSWESREQVHAVLNADGYGFGWYDGDDPLVYRRTEPIWADENLPALASTLRAPLWLAMVRSATAGYGVHNNNSQPFVFGRRLFMHNGSAKNFAGRMRRDLLMQLDDDTAASIRGHTDSEHLCALIHHYAQNPDSDSDSGSDIGAAFRRCAEWCANYGSAMLNFIVAERDAFHVMRHACDDKAPSLYSKQQPDGALLVASERFDDDALWREVPAGSILTVRDQAIAQSAL